MVRLCVAEGYRSDWYDDPKVIADVFCNPLIGYREQLNQSFSLNRCSGPPHAPLGLAPKFKRIRTDPEKGGAAVGVVEVAERAANDRVIRRS